MVSDTSACNVPPFFSPRVPIVYRWNSSRTFSQLISRSLCLEKSSLFMLSKQPLSWTFLKLLYLLLAWLLPRASNSSCLFSIASHKFPFHSRHLISKPINLAPKSLNPFLLLFLRASLLIKILLLPGILRPGKKSSQVIIMLHLRGLCLGFQLLTETNNQWVFICIFCRFCSELSQVANGVPKRAMCNL